MASSGRIGYIAAASADAGRASAPRRGSRRRKIRDPRRFAMAHPERLRRRPALAPLLVVLVALLMPAAALAQSAELFEVRDVPVDVTAKSAADARDQAVLQGHRKAFDTLVGRLVSSEDAARLPKLSDDQLTDLVKSFEVEEEHVSDV